MTEDFKEYSQSTFLKWAGGKQRQIRHIVPRLPDGYDRLVEPFLGAASVFLRLQPAKALLSDLNPDLIAMYESIATDPDSVFDALVSHARRDHSKHYYSVRNHFNNGLRGAGRAAAFIYLNRAGYNGIYRVNTRGKFNVPYGKKAKALNLPSLDSLQRFSSAFRNAKFVACDFEETVDSTGPGDFIYADPPYWTPDAEDTVTKYTQSRFGIEDHERLHAGLQRATQRSVKAMVHAADHPDIREIFGDWDSHREDVTRSVSPKSESPYRNELIFVNY